MTPRLARFRAGAVSFAASLTLAMGCALSVPAPADAAINAQGKHLGAPLDLRPTGPVPAACPGDLDKIATCHAGWDVHGAHYWIAMPRDWNGALVVFMHGGPKLFETTAENNGHELLRNAFYVKAGYAWVHSSYRSSGYGVRKAAEDSDNARKIFVGKYGAPRRTFAHGHSWGGAVGSRLAETLVTRADGRRLYDGVLLTNGVVSGGARAYDFRVDLRAVYQHYCHNHPRPSEPQYELGLGLPAGSTMTGADLYARVAECTGIDKPQDKRSPQQRARLADILAVTRIAEGSLMTHMNWATFNFADLAQRVAGGNPFGNELVRYTGSSDDATLNRLAPRIKRDPKAFARLVADAELTGQIRTNVLTLHAIGDPVVFVEGEAAYRDKVRAAGRLDMLAQVFIDEKGHNSFGDAHTLAAMDALAAWAETGDKPGPDDVSERCETLAQRTGDRCAVRVDYQPDAFENRVYARSGPSTSFAATRVPAGGRRDAAISLAGGGAPRVTPVDPRVYPF